jgi:hypothetical protein
MQTSSVWMAITSFPYVHYTDADTIPQMNDWSCGQTTNVVKDMLVLLGLAETDKKHQRKRSLLTTCPKELGKLLYQLVIVNVKNIFSFN